MKLDPTNFRLSHHSWNRRIFDPTSAEDLRVYQEFLLRSRWYEGCPFIVEWPFLNVVDMIRHKIIQQHIGTLISRAKK
jgi:hypothetical protein